MVGVVHNIAIVLALSWLAYSCYQYHGVAYAALNFAVFIVVVIFIMYIIGLRSGWIVLSRRFATKMEPPENSWHRQRIWFGKERYRFTVGATAEGIFFSVDWMTSPVSNKLFIPWSEVEWPKSITFDTLGSSDMKEISLGAGEKICISMKNELADKIYRVRSSSLAER